MIEDFIAKVRARKNEIRSVLKKNGNILLITTQNSLNGRVCEFISRKVFSSLLAVKLPASNQDKTLEYYDMSRFDAVLMVGMTTDSQRLLNRRNFFLIDNHETTAKKTGTFVFHSPDKCGCVLLKNFYEVVFDEDFGKFEETFKLTNDFELWEKKYDGSRILDHLCKVRPWSEFQERLETFDGTFTPEELELYNKEISRLRGIWDNLTFHVDGHCMVVLEENFSNIICDWLFERTKTINALIWIWYPSGGSVRLREGKETIFSMGDYLRKNNLGGGQKRYGGFRVPYGKPLSATVEKMIGDFKEIE